MELQSYVRISRLVSSVGNFVIIDLIAATTNALNGALLAQRPDYYHGKQWTVVGIIILAHLRRHRRRRLARCLAEQDAAGVIPIPGI